MKGEWLRTNVRGAALEGNALLDAVDRPLWIYLPPEYARDPERRFPTCYFLHPYLSSGASWSQSSPFARTVPERMDALVADGKIPPFIGVFPDGSTALGGTQWNNSPAVGNYQDYLVQDVVPHVDHSFRTFAQGESRLVLGRSSGGYGALLLGKNHPDVFSHIHANAADSFFEYCYLPDFPKAAGALLNAGGVAAWFRDFTARAQATKMRSDDFSVINIVAMAASYSPDADAPLGLTLPFDLDTARPREAVFARWLEADPVRFIPANPARVSRLKSAFVECGTRDEYNMRWGMRMVARALEEVGVPVTHEEFDDGHGGTNYRFDRALSVMVPKLATK